MILTAVTTFTTLLHSSFSSCCLAQQPNADQGRLISGVSRARTTHTHTQSWYDSPGRVIGPTSRPVPDNTQHLQDIQAPSEIQTRNITACDRPQTPALDRSATRDWRHGAGFPEKRYMYRAKPYSGCVWWRKETNHTHTLSYLTTDRLQFCNSHLGTFLVTPTGPPPPKETLTEISEPLSYRDW
jgi:hypothetical protein